MDPVVHFEIPVDDIKRAKTFYQKTFGWDIKQFESPDVTMEYFSVITRPENSKNSINGGMMKRTKPGQQPLVYAHVDSVAAALQKAIKNGGKIAIPKTNIAKDESMGAVGAFIDTEGNMIGVVDMPPPKKK